MLECSLLAQMIDISDLDATGTGSALDDKVHKRYHINAQVCWHGNHL